MVQAEYLRRAWTRWRWRVNSDSKPHACARTDTYQVQRDVRPPAGAYERLLQ